MLPIFNLKYPVDQYVFFPEMFLYIDSSELLRNNSMFLHLSLIHFSLSSSHLFWLTFTIFRNLLYYFSLASFFHKGPKYAQSLIFVWFSFLLVVFVQLLLLWSLLWTLPILGLLPHHVLRLQIYFGQPHDSFLERIEF